MSNRASEFLSTIFVVLAAIGIAIVLTLFVFQSYQVDGPSMQPSLHNGDRLIIWKVPRTIARISGDAYIPNRGDVIVFSEPAITEPDGSPKQLIKRVLALPGERVVVHDGVVTVYNADYPGGFRPDTTLPYGEGINLTVDVDQDIDITIPDGEIYAMGDNRFNSMDSRIFGPVSADDIIGKLILRMYPFSDFKAF
jgi:signal peptidase I